MQESVQATNKPLATRELPDWVPDVHSHLDEVAKLPANWNSYGANAPDRSSIEAAKKFIDEIARFVGVERPDVAVSPQGNAALCWEWNSERFNLDVEISPQGHIEYAFTDHEDESNDLQDCASDSIEIVELLTTW